MKYADDVIHVVSLHKGSDINDLIRKQIEDNNSWYKDNGLSNAQQR